MIWISKTKVVDYLYLQKKDNVGILIGTLYSGYMGDKDGNPWLKPATYDGRGSSDRICNQEVDPREEYTGNIDLSDHKDLSLFLRNTIKNTFGDKL